MLDYFKKYIDMPVVIGVDFTEPQKNMEGFLDLYQLSDNSEDYKTNDYLFIAKNNWFTARQSHQHLTCEFFLCFVTYTIC